MVISASLRIDLTSFLNFLVLKFLILSDNIWSSENSTRKFKKRPFSVDPDLSLFNDLRMFHSCFVDKRSFISNISGEREGGGEDFPPPTYIRFKLAANAVF